VALDGRGHKLKGKPMGDKHKEYQKARNKLIPFAVKYANKQCGKESDGNYIEWTLAWNTAFLGEMNRLARGQRLIGG